MGGLSKVVDIERMAKNPYQGCFISIITIIFLGEGAGEGRTGIRNKGSGG